MSGDFETHPTGTVKALEQRVAELEGDNERLRSALQDIVIRSRIDPLGTSKVVDMRNIAKAALKGEEG